MKKGQLVFIYSIFVTFVVFDPGATPAGCRVIAAALCRGQPWAHENASGVAVHMFFS